MGMLRVNNGTVGNAGRSAPEIAPGCPAASRRPAPRHRAIARRSTGHCQPRPAHLHARHFRTMVGAPVAAALQHRRQRRPVQIVGVLERETKGFFDEAFDAQSPGLQAGRPRQVGGPK